MNEPAIHFEGFTKRYGRRVAVDALSLQVARGRVCGLLGQNGAGKTTTIRCMLDLLRPSAGSITVLGHDSVRDSVRLRSKVGYLPEDPTYYTWMKVAEIVAFNAGFFSSWDQALADTLIDRLELPRQRRMGELSRGMQAKVGLVMALAQRPELLLLDDPTSGLDPLARRDFLEAMIANVQAEGGTVFFSSHLIHELEQFADEVAILHHGRLRLRGSIEKLKSSRKRVRVVYPGPEPPGFVLPGVSVAEAHAHHAVLSVVDFDTAMPAALRAAGAESVEVIDLDLEEIFIDIVKGNGSSPQQPAAGRPGGATC